MPLDEAVRLHHHLRQERQPVLLSEPDARGRGASPASEGWSRQQAQRKPASIHGRLVLAFAPRRSSSDSPRLSFSDRVGTVMLYSMLAVWAPDAGLRRRILVRLLLTQNEKAKCPLVEGRFFTETAPRQTALGP